MARFWIDYSTSVLIEAETAEEAVEDFFRNGDYNAIGYTDIQIDAIKEEDYDK